MSESNFFKESLRTMKHKVESYFRRELSQCGTEIELLNDDFYPFTDYHNLIVLNSWRKESEIKEAMDAIVSKLILSVQNNKPKTIIIKYGVKEIIAIKKQVKALSLGYHIIAKG